MEGPSFTLIILLATLRFTSSSSVSFEQHGCESLFTTVITNSSVLVTFYNIPLNLSFQKQVSDFPVVYSTPADTINNVTEIKWEVSYQSTIQNFTAPVPATCCVGHTTPRSINCVDVNITCSSSQCSLAKPWNVYTDFYKMNCKNCVCTYCYKGGPALHQLFQVSLKQQDFVTTEQFSKLIKAQAATQAIPADFKTLALGILPSYIVLDNPNDETWIRISQFENITYILKTVLTDLPEMTIVGYLKNILQNVIQQFNFYFYPPIQCNIMIENTTTAIINKTAVIIFTCNNTSSRTLVYKVNDDAFQLRDGKMYVMKEVQGTREIRLSVQYQGISSSERAWKFNFTVPMSDSQTTVFITYDLQSTMPVTTEPTVTGTLGPESTTPVSTDPQVLRIAAELLTSDSVSLTCYTNYGIQNLTYLWYISKKPVTGVKTEQILANNRSQETITVLNLNQYISQQTQLSVICQVQHNKVIFDGQRNFDFKSFPVVQLKAPERSPSYSVVEYSCNTNISKAYVEIHLKSIYAEVHTSSGSSYTGNFTMVNDTKISCFGVSGDLKGIVKEQIVYIFNANASSLNGVGITMHSFNNITFTCFSESTFAETAYHWYLNGTKTIAGTQKEMPGNQTFGYLTLKNLPKDAYVTVTCKWHYRHFFVDERSISASLLTIPQVSLISPGASSLYSVVKYSCISNVTNAYVHFAVVPLSYKNVSYRVNKGSYEGNFTIMNDTKIFCFANYNGQRGIIQESVVLARAVNAPLLDGVAVIMHSFSNITFSCFSNRTSLNTKYEWFLNDNIIATGISERTLDNKIYGYLTLTNINQNARVKITCKLFYSNNIVDEKSVNISIPSIPQVRLTSPNTSSLYSEVNYSCVSSLASADVYVAVIPLHHKNISYSVQKASYTGRFTMFNDTKIFCFANYNGQRGIIQENVIRALAVNASLLDGVGVIMHSFSNITFSCFSNRTSLYTKYEWFLNDNTITTGISERTLGNKIYGYLTLTNINQNARVKITCKLFYSNSIVDERSINISIPSIPQVRLTSPNTSTLYSEVNYNCVSNLASADVYVAVIPLHHKNISYSVQKANYTGRFTIFNDTKIFCFANYNGQRGIIQENVVLAHAVNAPLLDGVAVIMHSFSNITFSCFSNRTSLNTKYEWFLNDNIITTGIFERTLGNKIYSYLTLTNIDQNARVKITCRLFYSNIFVEERIINISIDSVPQVSLNSPNVSSLHSEVNYSCVSNLPKADVYVAVVPFHYKNISYSVQKAKYSGNFTIQQDMKIFCYANHNGQRGIIKQNVVLLKEVQRFTIQRITTTMHSDNNIMFTCYTNSTAASITYEWYVNGSRLTAGIRQSVGQNESQSEVTLTNLPRNYFAIITCRTFHGTLFMDDQNITTDIASIPQVTINSQNLSLSNSVVNYNCNSNVQNADVYATEVPSTHKTVSYPPAVKGNVTGRFTMVNETKIFCYAEHGNKRGIIKSKTVYLLKIPRFSILEITTKQSANNITFTCRTNSNLTNIKYKWYFNNTDITTRMTQMMVNGESQSEVTLSNLGENNSDSITCEAFYETLRIDKKKMYTSISSIPQVTVNVFPMSLAGYFSNYSCKSSVNDSKVHVTVEYSGSSKSYTNISSYMGRFLMVNDTKISCYADGGGRRGLTKEKMVTLAKVAHFLITQITTTMYSIDNITFACYTNSSSTAITYKWHLNDNVITSGKKQMLVNTQSVGFLTLSDLRQKDKDSITCEAFYEILRIDKKKIYASISSIPQVTVNVFQMSLVGYFSNYSCKSSVNDSKVHVTVEYSGSSKSYTNVSSYMGRFLMVNDTKISCYADGGGRRGLTKEKMVTLAKVEYFIITRITTTMHSIDNITFACYTNSSSTAITYKWYFNDSVIASGKKQMLVNSQSIGFLTLSNLRPKDKGFVTCEAYFEILRIAKKRIDFSVSTIPRVTIASAQVADIDSQVAYSCRSSVKNADVYVSFPNTESIKPGENRSSYNGEFTIKSDTKISCYSKHNFLQGSVVETTVFASKGEKSCEAETAEKLVWPKTLSKKNATVSCPEGFEGSVTRQCNKDGQWENFDQAGCAKTEIIDAKADLEKISLGLSNDLATPVKELATATNTTLKKKELVISFEAIKEIVEITEDLTDIKENEISNFFEIGSNLLNLNNKDVWDSIDKEDSQQVDKTPQNMIKNIEKFATVTAEKTNKTLVIQKENLLVEIKKASVNETLKLPTSQVKATTPEWIQNSLTTVTIPSESLKEVFKGNETISVATTIFKDVSGLIQGVGKTKLNSYVLSLSFAKATPVNLSNPILLNFEHLLSNFSKPQCSFWNFNLTNTTGGGWSREGCTVNSTNSTFTRCACNHLTNFAILMNPWTDVQTTHAIQLITTIGCWISIVALVITILVYITCWKHVASRDVAKSRSVLLINLCLSLACVYLIFLFGIERTYDKDVCTATAILLLYFLLVAFFSMLAEGIDIAVALTVVFTSDFPRLPWLIATSWLAPAIIVGISLGATQLEGFGNDKFCWLDRASGLIWALVAPVIAIIIANIICCIFALRALMSAGSILKHTTKPTTAERIRKGARALLVLSPLLGFTWIIGLFAVNEDTVVFEYIFAILATLQGFFVFLAYCLFNDQLRKAFVESKFRTQYLSTKQSTLSQSKTIKGSFDDTNKNEIKSSYASNSQPYESNKEKNIKRNADFMIKRNSDFNLKKE